MKVENYLSEIKEDKFFKEINTISLNYMGDEESISHIPKEYLELCKSFLISKYNYLIELQESFELPHYSWSFAEIAYSLDIITLEKDNDEIIKQKLAKDISVTIDLVELNYEIINKILKSIDS